MYKIILLFFLSLLINCQKSINLRKGKFKIINSENEITSFIERKGEYQLEYKKDTSQKELILIKWFSNTNYSLEVIDKNDSLDYLPIIVEIDSVRSDTYYQKTFIEGIDIIYQSKIVKIDNDVSEMFNKEVEKYLKKKIDNIPAKL